MEINANLFNILIKTEEPSNTDFLFRASWAYAKSGNIKYAYQQSMFGNREKLLEQDNVYQLFNEIADIYTYFNKQLESFSIHSVNDRLYSYLIVTKRKVEDLKKHHSSPGDGSKADLSKYKKIFLGLICGFEWELTDKKSWEKNLALCKSFQLMFTILFDWQYCYLSCNRDNNTNLAYATFAEAKIIPDSISSLLVEQIEDHLTNKFGVRGIHWPYKDRRNRRLTKHSKETLFLVQFIDRSSFNHGRSSSEDFQFIEYSQFKEKSEELEASFEVFDEDSFVERLIGLYAEEDAGSAFEGRHKQWQIDLQKSRFDILVKSQSEFYERIKELERKINDKMNALLEKIKFAKPA